MCQLCAEARYVDERVVGRRGFLKLAGAAAVGVAAAGHAFAEEVKQPPKPENVVSPDVALERLMAGNKRYVEGVARRHDFKAEREALSAGQNPFAGILSCADSRVAPEYAFDTGRGDLFVVRVAGNFATDDGIASFEYAAQVLSTPLIMVLGHEACGAVSATIKSIKDNTTLPGHLPALVTSLSPAVKAVLDKPGDTLNNAIRQNVILNVEKLKTAAPILSKAVEDKRVHVVGAVYNLANGRVELVT
jgi:carbonic anhydrase